MDRKWRTNKAAIRTVLSFPDFSKLFSPWKTEYKLASLTDLYSVYTVLHIESKEWEAKWSEEGCFYYFLVKETIVEDQIIHAPEGDEDVPELITEAEAGEGTELSLQEIEQNRDNNTDGNDTDMATDDNGTDTTITDNPETQTNTSDTQEKQIKIRTQLIIPISSASNRISPVLLQKLFSVRGEKVQQMILGLVDSNGVVSRCCMYNYIQAPLEGPGTANLQLLDD